MKNTLASLYQVSSYSLEIEEVMCTHNWDKISPAAAAWPDMTHTRKPLLSFVCVKASKHTYTPTLSLKPLPDLDPALTTGISKKKKKRKKSRFVVNLQIPGHLIPVCTDLGFLLRWRYCLDLSLMAFHLRANTSWNQVFFSNKFQT